MSAQIFDFTPTAKDRLPPQNIEAEEAVLGGILLDPFAMLRVVDILEPEAFYVSHHATIYRAAQDLYNAQQPVDLQTVTNRLSDRNQLATVGGRTKMAQLVDRTVSAVNIDALAMLLREKAVSRRMIAVGNEISTLGYDQAQDLSTRLDSAEQRVFALRQRDRDSSKPELVADISVQVYQQMEHLANTGECSAIATGFYDLDDLLAGGLYPEDLIIVGGRPSMGKSLLACSIAYQIAALKSAPTLIFSLEMSKEAIVQRFISNLAEIKGDKLRQGKISGSEWVKVATATDTLSKVPVLVDDTPCPSVQEIRSKVRSVISQYGGLKMVAIDYLQLMVDGADNRSCQKLGEVTRLLKLLARECKVPIMVLSQLNRGVEERSNKRPMMSDIRECLTRDCYLTDAVTGIPVSIADVKVGQKIWAVSKDQKIVPALISNVWSKGEKEVYRLTTQSGRTIKATANHPVLTQKGYVPISRLTITDLIATSRRITCEPSGESERVELALILGYMVGDGSFCSTTSFIASDELVFQDCLGLVSNHFPRVSCTTEMRHPRTGNVPVWEVNFVEYHKPNYGKPGGNSLRNWIGTLGLIGKKAADKFVPEWVYSLGTTGAAQFLAGYLAMDGCVKKNSRHETKIHFDTISERLAADTQNLLLRIGVVASIAKPSLRKGCKPIYRVSLSENLENLTDFVLKVPVVGGKSFLVQEILKIPVRRVSGSDIFALPVQVSELLKQKTVRFRQQGIKRQPEDHRPWHHQGKRLNRSVCQGYATILQDGELSMWAESDLLWEKIRFIEYIGIEKTWDIRVPQTGNFLANNIVVHNSGRIEEDADVILFPYRDEYYNNNTLERGVMEIICTKHRNGPTGAVKLLFDGTYSRLRNLTTVQGRI